MPNNPYTPPRAPLRDSTDRGHGSPWKAILLGVVTDMGSTVVVSVILSVLAALTLGDGAADPDVLRGSLNSGVWQMLGMVLGSLCTLLGGYVAARVANHAEYRYAAICGVIALVLSEMLASSTDVQSDFGLRIAGWIVTVPLAMLGARLRLHQKERIGGPQPQQPDA